MNIQWAPDYSSYVDLDKHPGATWSAGSAGGGDDAAKAAGWYTPSYYDEGLIPGKLIEDGHNPTYDDLKAAGLWNLTDLNSDTWKFLQTKTGLGDVKTNNTALFQALQETNPAIRGSDRIPQANDGLREMLGGLNPKFVDAFVGAQTQYLQYTYDHRNDFNKNTPREAIKDFAGLFTQTPLGIALAAFTGGASMAAGGTAAGSGALAGGVMGGMQGLANGGNLSDIAGSAAKGAATGAAGSLAGGVLGGGGESLSSVGGDAGLTGAADTGTFDQFGSSVAPGSDATIFGGNLTNPFPADLAGSFDLFGSLASPSGGGSTIFDAPQGALGATGGTMDDLSFLDDLINNTGGSFGSDVSLSDLGGDTSFWSDGGGGFRDPWDMLTNQDTVYQSPEAMNMPLPNGGVTGGGGGLLDSILNGSGNNPNSLLRRMLGAFGTSASRAGTTGVTSGTSAQRLARILNGEGSLEDILGVGGSLAPAALSMYGLNKQSQTMSDIARQQQAAEQARYQDLVGREQARYQDVTQREDARLGDLISREQGRFNTLTGREDAAIARQRGDIDYGRSVGAPYRDQLAGLYANPSSFLSSPEVTVPVQQGTDALARALSVKGNPAGSGSALQAIQDYASNQLFGRLGEEKTRLGTLGGLPAFNQAGATVPGIGTSLSGSVPAPGSLYSGSSGAGSGIGTAGGLSALMGGAQASASMWGDLGKGLGNVMNPNQQTSLAQFLKQMSLT